MYIFYFCKMESGRTMLLHAILLGIVLYLIMHFVLGQSCSTAENRSIFIAGVALIYMMLFGHGLPSTHVRF